MTDWTARELTLDLSFLPEGNSLMDAYQDGVNADRWTPFSKDPGRAVASAKSCSAASPSPRPGPSP
jgi:alpha-glucosidase